jgi:hypothetical protein
MRDLKTTGLLASLAVVLSLIFVAVLIDRPVTAVYLAAIVLAIATLVRAVAGRSPGASSDDDDD